MNIIAAAAALKIAHGFINDFYIFDNILLIAAIFVEFFFQNVLRRGRRGLLAGLSYLIYVTG